MQVSWVTTMGGNTMAAGDHKGRPYNAHVFTARYNVAPVFT